MLSYQPASPLIWRSGAIDYSVGRVLPTHRLSVTIVLPTDLWQLTKADASAKKIPIVYASVSSIFYVSYR